MFVLIKIKKFMNRFFCVFGLHEMRLLSRWEVCYPAESGFFHQKQVVNECRFCSKREQTSYENGQQV
jgi:hypothetical protein